MKKLLFSLAALAALTSFAGRADAQISITTTSPLPDGYVSVYYSQLIQYTAFSPNPVTWSVTAGALPPGVTLSSTGYVAGYPTTPGNYSFTIQVSLSGGLYQASVPFTLKITAPTVSIATTSIPAANYGVAYSTQLSVSTNTSGQSFIWSLASGSLPPGLTLSAQGIIGGTPSQTGVYSFSITATLQYSSISSTSAFTMTVYSAPFSISTPATLPTAILATNYSVFLQTTPSVQATWAVSRGTLPVGLTLSTNGLLSGVVSAVGTTTFDITATDSTNNTATKTFTITAAIAKVSIAQTSLPYAVQGQAYSTALTPQGGTPPYQWSVTSGGSNLAIDVNGNLSGTPTSAGSFAVVVTLSDSAGGSYSYTYSLLVATPLRILTTTLPSAATGNPYSQTISAGGGQAPYSFSVSQGTLPPGLLLSTSGVLSGTPTSNGLYNFTIQVSDAGSRTATQALSISIGSGPTITTTSLPGAAVGVAYLQPIGISGGFAPYTITISAGSLPPGLAVDTNGNIAGTPTTTGSYPFTVQVTDTGRNVTQKAFTIQVYTALSLVTTLLPGGQVGVGYSQTMQASGGATPYSWAADGGVPGVFQMNPGTGLLTANFSAAGGYLLTVTVTDAVGQTAKRTFSINVLAALTLSSGSFTATAGTAFSQKLVGSGGTVPYTIQLAGGSLPPGLKFDPTTQTISGTPTAAGTFSTTFSITDAASASSSAQVTIVVGLPSISTVSLSGLPSNSPPGKQTAVNLSLGSAFPVDLTGTLTLTFASSVGGDDALIRFSNGTRSVAFSIAAGQTTATFSSAPGLAVLTGTVAGTITVSATVQAGGVDVTPSPAPSVKTVVDPAAPVITAVTMAQGSGSLTVTVTGYATSREMVSGLFHFTAPTGTTLTAGDVTVQLGSAFSTWYGSSASNAFGSQFTLTMPFTVAGSGTIPPVSVTLTNSKGSSAAMVSQ